MPKPGWGSWNSMRSFIKRIEVDAGKVTVFYHLPLTVDGRGTDKTVLPIATFGGPFGTVPELLFERKQLIPALQELLVSYCTMTMNRVIGRAGWF